MKLRMTAPRRRRLAPKTAVSPQCITTTIESLSVFHNGDIGPQGFAKSLLKTLQWPEREVLVIDAHLRASVWFAMESPSRIHDSS